MNSTVHECVEGGKNVEVQFENEYTMNKELIKEYVHNVLSKNTIIMGMLLTLLGIILLFVHIETIYPILVIIFGITLMLFPMIMTSELEKASKRLNNGTIEKTNVKFGENIVMDEGKAHLEFEYSQITKILQTKSFIVLQTSKQSAILVLKNGFTKGEEKEFMEFIEEKTNCK